MSATRQIPTLQLHGASQCKKKEPLTAQGLQSGGLVLLEVDHQTSTKEVAVDFRIDQPVIAVAGLEGDVATQVEMETCEALETEFGAAIRFTDPEGSAAEAGGGARVCGAEDDTGPSSQFDGQRTNQGAFVVGIDEERHRGDVSLNVDAGAEQAKVAGKVIGVIAALEFDPETGFTPESESQVDAVSGIDSEANVVEVHIAKHEGTTINGDVRASLAAGGLKGECQGCCCDGEPLIAFHRLMLGRVV